MLDRVPYGTHNDPGMGLAAVVVRREQGGCRLRVRHSSQGVAHALPAIIDITEVSARVQAAGKLVNRQWGCPVNGGGGAQGANSPARS